MSDSVVLTCAGRSFHYCGAKTEKTCDFVVQPLFTLSNSGTRHLAEVVERSSQAGIQAIQVIGEGIGSATCPGLRGSKPNTYLLGVNYTIVKIIVKMLLTILPLN